MDSPPTPAPTEPPTRTYAQLRALARRQLAGERADYTLQPTALVHEAWMRLLRSGPDPAADPRGFALAAAEAMRRVLIDHARRRARDKRGGARRALSLDALEVADSGDFEGIVAVDDALRRLEEVHPRTAEVVRLRFFAGMEEAEVARALDLSPRTVRREWSFARAWLYRALEP